MGSIILMPHNALVLLGPDAILAACYGALVLLLVHSPARRTLRDFLRDCFRHRLRFFLLASAFSCPYNLVYRDLSNIRPILVFALCVRLCAPIEAVYRAAGSYSREMLSLAAWFIAIAGAAATSPLANGWLTLRPLLNSVVAMVCVSAWIVLPHGKGIFARHLRLQTVWILDQCATDWAACWHRDPAANDAVRYLRYNIERWGYAATVVAIVLIYEFWFTSRPAHREAPTPSASRPTE